MFHVKHGYQPSFSTLGVDSSIYFDARGGVVFLQVDPQLTWRLVKMKSTCSYPQSVEVGTLRQGRGIWQTPPK